MAIILSGLTKCSICDAVIESDEEIVATTHFITDQNDPLWRFSDSAMHKSCFVSWTHKQSFINQYNETVGNIVWGNKTQHHMEDDGHIFILKIE